MGSTIDATKPKMGYFKPSENFSGMMAGEEEEEKIVTGKVKRTIQNPFLTCQILFSKQLVALNVMIR